MKVQEAAPVRARVCLSLGERARVLVDGRECDALVRGDLPVTGDWVQVRLVEPELALIVEIEPRRSKIARRSAGRAAFEQVLAANVDLALIVCGLDGDFNVRRIERYLALAHDGGVEPVVVLNKADVCEALDPLRQEAEAVARMSRVIPVSALTGSGFDSLEALLQPDVTAVLLGSSGAGKSSILNRLLKGVRQRTGAVRESDSRGRHTTTNRELIVLPNGASVIDSPGLREIQLLVGAEALDAVFDEIAALAERCRFGDCTHASEPGCAVRDAVPAGRLESFHKLQREAMRLNGERSEKQRWRGIHKAVRRFYKQRGH